MKIQFDFPRRKGSVYQDLLADYIGRMREFAKMEEVKGEALELCFVHGLHLEAAGRPLLELSSEALSEHIMKSLSAGVSNIRVAVRHISHDSPMRASADAPSGIVLLRAEIGEDFAEVLAAEQVYRAFMIAHNRKYHK